MSNRTPREYGNASSGIGATVAIVRRSFLLMVAAAGVVTSIFAAVVLPALGKPVWAGILGVVGATYFVVGVGGYGLYKWMERAF